MKKLILIFLITFSFAKDSRPVIQQKVLFVEHLLKIEEKIALAYEEYLLNEYSLPTFTKLIDKGYLGGNFSKKNILGNELSFFSIKSLQLNYAIKDNRKPYLHELYKRDLYRKNSHLSSITSEEGITTKFVQLNLISKEAITIRSILDEKHLIYKNCVTPIKQTYCINKESIRWYESNSKWIEYDKENFEEANVTIVDISLLNNSKLHSLKFGSFVFIQNGAKYIKYLNNTFLRVK